MSDVGAFPLNAYPSNAFPTAAFLIYGVPIVTSNIGGSTSKQVSPIFTQKPTPRLSPTILHSLKTYLEHKLSRQ